MNNLSRFANIDPKTCEPARKPHGPPEVVPGHVHALPADSTRSGLASLILVVACLYGPPALAANYTFTTLNAPGTPIGDFAYASSINDFGQVVVVAYHEAVFAGIDLNDIYNLNTHAYSSLPSYPGSAPTSTSIFSINNTGTMVGDYHPPGGAWQGFSYSAGTFTGVNAFGGSWNAAIGISNNGQIAGYAGDVNSAGNIQTQGYLYSGGQYTAINGGAYPQNSTIAFGVNNSGAVVGVTAPTASNSGIYSSFLYQSGVYTSISMPGEQSTTVEAINDAGVVAGYASNDGFVTSIGFVDNNGVFTAINVPGSSVTSIDGINNLGQIVGDYVDQNGNVLAFVATPAVPEPATWALSLLGLGAIAGAAWTRSARAPREPLIYSISRGLSIAIP